MHVIVRQILNNESRREYLIGKHRDIRPFNDAYLIDLPNRYDFVYPGEFEILENEDDISYGFEDGLWDKFHYRYNLETAQARTDKTLEWKLGYGDCHAIESWDDAAVFHIGQRIAERTPSSS
jgi:hypothetical protein